MIVLAVDDDPMMLKAISRLFGKKTHLTANLDEAAVLAQRVQPDVILLDATIDHQDDGIEAIGDLLCRSPQSRVFVITSLCTTIAWRRSVAYGACAYVDKIHIARLREIVEEIIASPAKALRPLSARELLH